MFHSVNAINSGSGGRRKCPRCGSEQRVFVTLRKEVVRCHRCGARIPPPKDERPETRARR
jgi:ribosomal protein S27E